MQHLTSVWADNYAKSIATPIGNSIQVGISQWMVNNVGSLRQYALRIARASRTSWAACTSLRRWMDNVNDLVFKVSKCMNRAGFYTVAV